ncbi:MAG: ABC transporter permease [Anaerolineae bacterium]|nr:ABC transporter permease [Anaerolineae bacterium]NUQ06965.1 ABC transporter permease [Anaerolineae bacterium]
MMITSLLENTRIAASQLSGSKLRTALTMLGIIIGIASVVLLLSLGQGVQSYVTSRFESLGASLVRVSAQAVSGVTESLTLDLVDALADEGRAPAIAEVMPQTQNTYTVIYGEEDLSTQVTGVTPTYLSINDRSISAGRMFSDQDVTDAARVAVIGVGTAEDLFGTASPIGAQIRIRAITFEVIGLLDETGTSDDVIIVPISAAQTRLNASRTLTGEAVVSTILFKAVSNDQVELAIEQATRVLREERGIADGATDSFRMFSASTILDTLSGTIETITVFLGVLAGISLVVGGIGVMNIMLVTVNERTREIGLRKAVGARRFDIISQFLTEAVVMTLLGGVIGIAIALGAAAAITRLVEDFTVVVQPSSVALAVSISFLIGVSFGVFPANRAARFNPIDALRYE